MESTEELLVLMLLRWPGPGEFSVNEAWGGGTSAGQAYAKGWDDPSLPAPVWVEPLMSGNREEAISLGMPDCVIALHDDELQKKIGQDLVTTPEWVGPDPDPEL